MLRPSVKSSPSLPSFIRIRPPSNSKYYEIKEKLKDLKLNTVCEAAKCPNVSECWSTGTATIMLLGDTCTRFCKFCNVKTGNPHGVVDKDEPVRVAHQVASSELKYVVLTCVDRDDLSDGGAGIFAQTIKEIKKIKPNIKIEGLISDYGGKETSLKKLIDSPVDVLAHNIEVIKRLTSHIRDPRASYRQSLTLLKKIKELNPNILTKSSLMVGLGESIGELLESAADLRESGVDIITFGQYLRPSKKHHPVIKYYQPADFEHLEQKARKMNFLYVASGPLVRSSYKAAELFIHGFLTEN